MLATIHWYNPGQVKDYARCYYCDPKYEAARPKKSEMIEKIPALKRLSTNLKASEGSYSRPASK